ncbi:MAG: ATP-binding cassette domain-containing protein [Lachnospiraceae bacterium]|nr:ATP-binding cassette domain-containing protein [Lachnospiraceae bacterium]
MAENMIQADGLVKIYKTKQTEVLALQGLDLTVEEGELTALIGNSGSGKSTFLNMIGGLDRPSAGSLLVGGKNLFTMTEKDLVVYKRDTVGFVWQNNGRNLLPYLSAIENVMLPMHLSNGKKKRDKALELLERVGMSHKKYSRLNMLSGGEQQRIAIAIALANSPKLLLADEPTGSVDPMTANYIFDLFTELNKEGQTILIVTHDVALSKKVRRVVAIRDGKISSERILKESYADRLKEVSVDWRNEDTQEEYVVMDKAGRVQIPKELLSELNLSGNKLKLEMQDGKIIITAPEEEKREEAVIS